MRRFDFNGTAKALAAGAQTITFSSSEIESNRIVAYHFQTTVEDASTGNAVDIVSRIRVKANGVTRWDLTGAQLAAFFERTSWSNVLYGAGSNTFTLPFFNLTQHDEDVADQCQFEPGANASIEITFTSAAEVGQILCGWTQTNIPPVFYTKLIGQQMNIANGAVNGRFPISEGGMIMGWGMPMVGMTRARLVLNGTQWSNLPGQDYLTTTAGAAASAVQMLSEVQRYSTAQTPTLTVPANYFTLLTTKPQNGIQGQAGSSYVEIDTNGPGTWAGTANELLLWSAVPVGVPS